MDQQHPNDFEGDDEEDDDLLETLEHPFIDDFEDDFEAEEHPIFRDIYDGDLEAVQQRVLADETVLEERWGNDRWTPLIYAAFRRQPAIALWIIQHRGRHDVNATADGGWTALHYASAYGPLAVVQALVAAGADPAALNRLDSTPLPYASIYGHTDIVAFLLQLSAVKATIDHINQYQWTALSYASFHGHQPIVQLLLDAGADPTIPAGHSSPVNRALNNNHHTIAALLRHVIAEADRVRALHKARSLLGAGAGAALACLQGRVEQGQALPWVEVIPPQQQQHDEKLRATVALAVGVSGGEKDTGLNEELYVELLGYMLPLWADKGPAADDGLESEEEYSGSEDDGFDELSEVDED